MITNISKSKQLLYYIGLFFSRSHDLFNTWLYSAPELDFWRASGLNSVTLQLIHRLKVMCGFIFSVRKLSISLWLFILIVRFIKAIVKHGNELVYRCGLSLKRYVYLLYSLHCLVFRCKRLVRFAVKQYPSLRLLVRYLLYIYLYNTYRIINIIRIRAKKGRLKNCRYLKHLRHLKKYKHLEHRRYLKHRKHSKNCKRLTCWRFVMERPARTNVSRLVWRKFLCRILAKDYKRRAAWSRQIWSKFIVSIIRSTRMSAFLKRYFLIGRFRLYKQNRNISMKCKSINLRKLRVSNFWYRRLFKLVRQLDAPFGRWVTMGARVLNQCERLVSLIIYSCRKKIVRLRSSLSPCAYQTSFLYNGSPVSLYVSHFYYRIYFMLLSISCIEYLTNEPLYLHKFYNVWHYNHLLVGVPYNIRRVRFRPARWFILRKPSGLFIYRLLIKVTPSNCFVNLLANGRTLASSSCGRIGFRKTHRSTFFAAKQLGFFISLLIKMVWRKLRSNNYSIVRTRTRARSIVSTRTGAKCTIDSPDLPLFRYTRLIHHAAFPNIFRSLTRQYLGKDVSFLNTVSLIWKLSSTTYIPSNVCLYRRVVYRHLANKMIDLNKKYFWTRRLSGCNTRRRLLRIYLFGHGVGLKALIWPLHKCVAALYRSERWYPRRIWRKLQKFKYLRSKKRLKEGRKERDKLAFINTFLRRNKGIILRKCRRRLRNGLRNRKMLFRIRELRNINRCIKINRLRIQEMLSKIKKLQTIGKKIKDDNKLKWRRIALIKLRISKRLIKEVNRLCRLVIGRRKVLKKAKYYFEYQRHPYLRSLQRLQKFCKRILNECRRDMMRVRRRSLIPLISFFKGGRSTALRSLRNRRPFARFSQTITRTYWKSNINYLKNRLKNRQLFQRFLFKHKCVDSSYIQNQIGKYGVLTRTFIVPRKLCNGTVYSMNYKSFVPCVYIPRYKSRAPNTMPSTLDVGKNHKVQYRICYRLKRKHKHKCKRKRKISSIHHFRERCQYEHKLKTFKKFRSLLLRKLVSRLKRVIHKVDEKRFSKMRLKLRLASFADLVPVAPFLRDKDKIVKEITKNRKKANYFARSRSIRRNKFNQFGSGSIKSLFDTICSAIVQSHTSKMFKRENAFIRRFKLKKFHSKLNRLRVWLLRRIVYARKWKHKRNKLNLKLARQMLLVLRPQRINLPMGFPFPHKLINLKLLRPHQVKLPTGGFCRNSSTSVYPNYLFHRVFTQIKHATLLILKQRLAFLQSLDLRPLKFRQRRTFFRMYRMRRDSTNYKSIRRWLTALCSPRVDRNAGMQKVRVIKSKEQIQSNNLIIEYMDRAIKEGVWYKLDFTEHFKKHYFYKSEDMRRYVKRFILESLTRPLGKIYKKVETEFRKELFRKKKMGQMWGGPMRWNKRVPSVREILSARRVWSDKRLARQYFFRNRDILVDRYIDRRITWRIKRFMKKYKKLKSDPAVLSFKKNRKFRQKQAKLYCQPFKQVVTQMWYKALALPLPSATSVNRRKHNLRANKFSIVRVFRNGVWYRTKKKVKKKGRIKAKKGILHKNTIAEYKVSYTKYLRMYGGYVHHTVFCIEKVLLGGNTSIFLLRDLFCALYSSLLPLQKQLVYYFTKLHIQLYCVWFHGYNYSFKYTRYQPYLVFLYSKRHWINKSMVIFLRNFLMMYIWVYNLFYYLGLMQDGSIHMYTCSLLYNRILLVFYLRVLYMYLQHNGTQVYAPFIWIPSRNHRRFLYLSQFSYVVQFIVVNHIGIRRILRKFLVHMLSNSIVSKFFFASQNVYDDLSGNMNLRNLRKKKPARGMFVIFNRTWTLAPHNGCRTSKLRRK